MDDFKVRFWKWFDQLPEKAKRSYQNSHLDVAEEYFREFFYIKSDLSYKDEDTSGPFV